MDNDKILKPMTIAREEFVESLVKLTNDSHLPYFVIEDIFRSLLNEVHEASIKQLKEDKERYNKQLAESEASE